MLKINQDCVDENNSVREACQVSILIDAFSELKKKPPGLSKAIAVNVSSGGSCSCLSMFKNEK